MITFDFEYYHKLEIGLNELCIIYNDVIIPSNFFSNYDYPTIFVIPSNNTCGCFIQVIDGQIFSYAIDLINNFIYCTNIMKASELSIVCDSYVLSQSNNKLYLYKYNYDKNVCEKILTTTGFYTKKRNMRMYRNLNLNYDAIHYSYS